MTADAILSLWTPLMLILFFLILGWQIFVIRKLIQKVSEDHQVFWRVTRERIGEAEQHLAEQAAALYKLDASKPQMLSDQMLETEKRLSSRIVEACDCVVSQLKKKRTRRPK